MTSPYLSQVFLVILLGSLVTWLATHIVAKFLRTKQSPLTGSFHFLGSVIVPLVALCLTLDLIALVPREHTFSRVVQSAVGISIVWLAVSFLTALLMLSPNVAARKQQTPRLLIDIVRFSLLGVGASLVIASVWNRDLTPLLTTFGIGSIVLGLALQDTLGNLFAGLAMVVERPFSVGDWLDVNGIIGKVQQINWRSVHLVTRDMDLVIVANSVLTKDRISNFSRPTRTHGVRLNLEFSYDQQPNSVKAALAQAAAQTPGVIEVPPPDIRVLSFAANTVEYEVLFFIGEYQDLPRIRNEFMTRIWYVARRLGLQIPFPIQTVLHQPAPAKAPVLQEEPFELVRQSEILSVLSEQECRQLINRSALLTYAEGERIVTEGDPGTTLFIIVWGTARVVKATRSGTQEVATLGPPNFFGEMSILTGAARSATVIAAEDMRAIVVPHEVFQEILSTRPKIVEQLAGIAHTREQAMAEILKSSLISESPLVEETNEAIIARIRRFFGI